VSVPRGGMSSCLSGLLEFGGDYMEKARIWRL
jgi:hypothetical protein